MHAWNTDLKFSYINNWPRLVKQPVHMMGRSILPTGPYTGRTAADLSPTFLLSFELLSILVVSTEYLHLNKGAGYTLTNFEQVPACYDLQQLRAISSERVFWLCRRHWNIEVLESNPVSASCKTRPLVSSARTFTSGFQGF